ncbi:MAG: sigma-70 family RNA polymerase sigma factor [Planctomycetes bacterium]|nr:sigma-70 family RNA polymerase sigma factor [Planctomycetota bacterium]
MTEPCRLDRRDWMRSVLDRYEMPLTRYAARLVGDVDRARDVVQETFLRFCSDGAPQDDARIGPWLFAVCRNGALDVLRKEKSMQTLPAQSLTNVQSGAASRTDERIAAAPSAALEQSEMANQLHTVIATLPDNQQEAIRLRFQNDMSYREIGDVMQTSVGNVGYLLHHAIKTVREQLGIGLPTASTSRRNPS